MRRVKIPVNMLRRAVRSIAPLYWLAGLMRYVAFARKLRKENRVYAAHPSALPPPMLRYRVHGALDASSYVLVGGRVAKGIFDAVRKAGGEWMHLAVLDFACGPGRVATELKKLAPTCRFQGSDIDREAIEWAQEHLRDVGIFQANEPLPPTRYTASRNCGLSPSAASPIASTGRDASSSTACPTSIRRRFTRANTSLGGGAAFSSWSTTWKAVSAGTRT